MIEYHQYEHRDHDFDINVVHEYAPYHHDHGPGCGHLFYHNHWHYYPVTYYNRCRANSFFFFVDLGGYDVRYVPTYVREVQVRYETVPVDVYVADDPLSLAYRHFADGEILPGPGFFPRSGPPVARRWPDLFRRGRRLTLPSATMPMPMRI